ncbi:MAG: NAD(P)H-dependent oxidoreductase subunit E, partial [Kiritimatiellaeota bacterium]|nr:NAD(P)H-dependent oxidoreductase subunit E [Kiritimatiellota bacterium]
MEAVDSAIARLGTQRSELIALLQAIQAEYRYLPPEALVYLSQRTGIPEADITGVATFYGQFRLRPAGRHTVKVCVGTACHVKGAELTYEAFQRELGIAPGDDTDSAREFTVEKVACLGCCMLAVAVQSGQTIYANVTPSKVKAVIRDIRASADVTDGGVKGLRGQGVKGGGADSEAHPLTPEPLNPLTPPPPSPPPPARWGAAARL